MEILKQLGVDYLLVNSTNRYLTEYSALSENARYKLTGFSGSTGDALITEDKIYLFVDGRYHTQAEKEVKDSITVIKLQIGQKQDDEIRKIINPDKILGVVAKKVSQKRLEDFIGYKIKLLDKDPINDFTQEHAKNFTKAFEPNVYTCEKAEFISNLEEVSYITGLRDFSENNSSKIWAKLFIENDKIILFTNEAECDDFLSNYDKEVIVDKSKINVHDYCLIKYPVDRKSRISEIKSIKNDNEIEAYKKAFECTDKALSEVRKYIEQNDGLSESDISQKLCEEFRNGGAKCLSFNPIVAIDKNSALPHYAKNSKDIILKEGGLVLIDCGAYYESGLATDITRVFVKGKPSDLQKRVYTTVLKSFLNCFNARLETGIEYDSLAHKMLDDSIDGFNFTHGLGHGIGINVHEAPPNLSQNEIARAKILDGMCFTIEPGLYNPEQFGVRLENSCYKQNGKIYSFVKMGYESKLIDLNLLSEQEQKWLKKFKLI